ncbi:DUF3305 domain-containing protein [Variovorax sp. JS1663]|uniref:DUF3305 domain-containing protein n=1 Tax=Variovorax sp. JS1663 TaxID=1851577 RepID=UPI000B346336|nr:DUF3305 domain-containing protein [Variovorax sp. JS1663]OUM02394.1 hypothetical protein A8M77_10465 [Variovorax sp. JS1663]OUM02521.1 hypothetical protein A8M77_11180 [Variovorax sp. JS1663]
MNPPSATDEDTARPALEVAVVMRCERLHGPSSHWQPWRWALEDVVPDEPAFGSAPRLLQEDEEVQRWLHPGFRVELFRDDVDGLRLNAETPAPGWFVLWRMEEEAGIAAEPIARPVVVTLSYSEAGRWLDAQENVEQVPVPPEVADWLRAYVDRHYVDEPRRRKRPESFRSLVDRFGNAASVSTEKKRGRGAGDV